MKIFYINPYNKSMAGYALTVVCLFKKINSLNFNKIKIGIDQFNFRQEWFKYRYSEKLQTSRGGWLKNIEIEGY